MIESMGIRCYGSQPTDVSLCCLAGHRALEQALGGILIRDVAGDLYGLAAPGSMDKRSRELFWAFVD